MKIRMGLSKIGVIRFGILLAVTFSMWWFFRSYLFFLVMLFMIVAAAFFAWVLYFCREAFSVAMKLPDRPVTEKRLFFLKIQFENKKRFLGFTADLKYEIRNRFTGGTQKSKLHVWMMPQKGYEITDAMSCNYAGRMEVIVESFVVYDLFHLFYLKGLPCSDSGVIIYPQTENAKEEEIFCCVEGFPKDLESKTKGVDYSADYEIREYIPGDEWKNVHWKLTAKKEKIMVRERHTSGKQKINLLLPLSMDKEENNRLVGALYYLGQLFLEKEYPMELFWSGPDNTLHARYIEETGALEAAMGEILSSFGGRRADMVQAQMELERPGEGYILIQTGANKGAYIH